MLCCGRNHKDDISVLGTLLTDHDYRSFIGCARNAVNEKAKVVAGKRQTRVLQPRHANREPQGELVGRITVKPGRQHPVRSRSCSCLSSGRKHHRILRGSGVGDRHGRGGGGVGSLRDRGLRLRSRSGMGLRGRPPSTSEHSNLVETHDRARERRDHGGRRREDPRKGLPPVLLAWSLSHRRSSPSSSSRRHEPAKGVAEEFQIRGPPRWALFGGPCRTRTRDARVKGPALYPLS